MSGRASRPLSDLLQGLTTSPVPQEGLTTSTGPPGVLPDLSRISGRASRPLRDLLEGLLTPPGPVEGPTDPTRTSKRTSRTYGTVSRHLPYRRRASRPLQDLREGL